MKLSMPSVLDLWNQLASKPGGRTLFSRGIWLRAPYFATVKPQFVELAPGRAVVRMAKRRSVHNHIGTVHAIACCNLAEAAAGLLSEVSVPASHRWIPKGMTVEYLAKAGTDLEATAWPTVATEWPDSGFDYPIQVDVADTKGTVVVRAIISMWITPRR